jgi:hypothetical protein
MHFGLSLDLLEEVLDEGELLVGWHGEEGLFVGVGGGLVMMIFFLFADLSLRFFYLFAHINNNYYKP